jgi:hypothetical protein
MTTIEFEFSLADNGRTVARAKGEEGQASKTVWEVLDAGGTPLAGALVGLLAGPALEWRKKNRPEALKARIEVLERRCARAILVCIEVNRGQVALNTFELAGRVQEVLGEVENDSSEAV